MARITYILYLEGLPNICSSHLVYAEGRWKRGYFPRRARSINSVLKFPWRVPKSENLQNFGRFWANMRLAMLYFANVSAICIIHTKASGKYWAGWIVESLVSVALSYANSSQPLYIFMRQNMNSRKHFHTLCIDLYRGNKNWEFGAKESGQKWPVLILFG